MRARGTVGRPLRKRALALPVAIALASLAPAGAALAGSPPADRDHDGLANRLEHRLRLDPRHRDTDRDRLSDGYEVRRSRTNPRRRDTDRDGMSDGYEVRRSRTNPRRPNRARRRSPVGDGRLLYVDKYSVGGRCSDSRGAAEAASPATPWCSLVRATAAAPAPATILVRRGDYPAFETSGRRTRYLTMRPYPGEVASLAGVNIHAGYVRFEGFRLTATATVGWGSGDVAFVGNDWVVDGPSGGNLSLLAGAHDVLVEGNRISQRSDAVAMNAIDFNSTDTRPAISRVTIRGNRIGPIPGGGDAIQAKNTRSLLIEDNEILGVTLPRGSDAHPDVLQSIYGAVDLTLRGNFIHDIDAQGIAIDDFQGENSGFRAEDNVIARFAYPWVAMSFDVDGAYVAHNTIDGTMRFGGTGLDVFANIATWGFSPYAGATFARNSHNLSTRFTGAPGPGSIAGAPRYRNAAANDFTLTAESPGKRAAPDGSDLGAFNTVRTGP